MLPNTILVMNNLEIVLFVFIAATAISSARAQSCTACNCQVNNIEVLNQLVEAQVKHTLANEPIVRFLRISISSTNRNLKLFALNHTTLQASDATDSELANISLTNPSQAVTSSNNLLAYRPRFSDFHSSELAGLFINIEGVFPCLQQLPNGVLPNCQVFSREEDGFRDGNALIGAGDSGNHFYVFSSTSDIITYGIAIQNCPEFTTACFPSFHGFSLACYLPRAACS